MDATSLLGDVAEKKVKESHPTNTKVSTNYNTQAVGDHTLAPIRVRLLKKKPQ